MKLNKIFSIFIVAIFVFQTFSLRVFAEDQKNDLILSKRFIKENLVLTRTLSDLNSQTAKPHDKLQLRTLADIDCGNKVVIPCGSIIEGKVVKAKNNYILRTYAYIDILVTNIKMISGCNICFEKDPIKLRIVEPHYKSFFRRIFQRLPVIVSGSGVSIPLIAATGLSDGVIFAITVGAQTTAGFISGLIDPDIDKTRIDGAIIRAIEGTPLGTFLITAERGFEINASACSYVTIKLDEKAKQKIIFSMQRAVVSN